jgi:ABC-type oligopeptide transport system ATPase subunit
MEVRKMNNNAYVKIENVSMWYPHKSEKKIINLNKKWIKAVDEVSLSVNKGEILGVIGESGCGKSTLGRILARLEEPTNGDVLINETSTKHLIEKNPKKFRRLVQIIFQNPFDTFTPRDTIAEIMTRPLKIHSIGKNYEERYEKVKQALESGGLFPADDILKRYPHELSGGQLQRISILRAMLFNPEFIIADEPVSMLDVSVRAEIINMLKKLSEEQNSAVIFISHDIALTRYISDNINEEFQRNATVAEKFDNLYISKFYKLLSYGLLVRASELELEKIDKSEKQTEKYKKLEEAFETAKKALKDLSENLEKEINYQVVPIKKLVSIQLECGLIMADYLNRN